MCFICDRARAKSLSRRAFLGGAATAGTVLAVTAVADGATRPAAAQSLPPEGTGSRGRRIVIRNGTILSMDPTTGDHARADILIEGSRILAIGADIDAADAAVIDAAGRIVMPGFIDTHHHQFETALRSYLADGLLYSDGKPHGTPNYIEHILGKLAPVYRQQDVHINELFGPLSQLDAGVTTVLDISQIHHSPEHSDAAVAGLSDAGRRTAFGYFEGAGAGMRYPQDARRLKQRYFSSSDQLMTMVMGGEFYLPIFEDS